MNRAGIPIKEGLKWTVVFVLYVPKLARVAVPEKEGLRLGIVILVYLPVR